MTGDNGKIFFCTARIQICIRTVLEIKICFLISYKKKRFLKSHSITIFTFQSLKTKVILVMVCFVNF